MAEKERELMAALRELVEVRYQLAKRDREEAFRPRAEPVHNDALAEETPNTVCLVAHRPRDPEASGSIRYRYTASCRPLRRRLATRGIAVKSDG
jgi:hypothetical protein